VDHSGCKSSEQIMCQGCSRLAALRAPLTPDLFKKMPAVAIAGLL
jgi:hypothetical protein